MKNVRLAAAAAIALASCTLHAQEASPATAPPAAAPQDITGSGVAPAAPGNDMMAVWHGKKS